MQSIVALAQMKSADCMLKQGQQVNMYENTINYDLRRQSACFSYCFTTIAAAG